VSFIAAAFRLMPAEGVAGKPKVDVDAWLGTAAATPTTAGIPEVDVTHWLGTAAATPTVAGVPEVDVTHFGGSAGTFASGLPTVKTSGNVKKAAAFAKFAFLMTDSTNHNPVTGKTVTATISKDGGAFASLNSGDTVTEVGNGIYEVDLDATDTNANCLILRFTATGADDTFERVITSI
jgi:hypothetical protein